MSSNYGDSEAGIKELTKLEKFFVREGRLDLVESLRRATEDELKERLQKQAVHRQEIIDAKLKDEELQRAKDRARDLGSVYNEQTRYCDKISRFIHLLLQDKV